MDVKINDSQITVPVEMSTWGDLLDWIETDYLKAGQCITHVYLGGNESLNYRDSLVCGKAGRSISSRIRWRARKGAQTIAPEA